MNRSSQFKLVTIAVLLALVWLPVKAGAAECGSTASGFEAWKRQFAGEAQARGVSATAIAALMTTNYSTATIAADRGQRSFSLSLNQFLAKRGGSTIVARGRALKQSNAALFTSIQQRFGVPPGPVLAIWGWRRVSEGRAEIRTSYRRWRLSPTTAVARPISPTSSMRR